MLNRHANTTTFTNAATAAGVSFSAGAKLMVAVVKSSKLSKAKAVKLPPPALLVLCG